MICFEGGHLKGDSKRLLEETIPFGVHRMDAGWTLETFEVLLREDNVARTVGALSVED
jgi:hypothetical protein